MKVLAPAKINLALDILGKRKDGYHEISTIMQTIDLYDVITIEKSNEISVKTNNEELPDNKYNIAYKSAELFFESSKIKGGAKIFIEKNIPFGAGMGGGSSDGAYVFKALNELYNNPFSFDESLNICKKLGADVPFFLKGGTCLCEGIGEKLTSISPFPDCLFVICKPDFSVSTKWVYCNLIVNNRKNHPDIQKLISYCQNNDLCNFTKNTYNFLENVTIEKYPEIEELKISMENLGALKSLMTGSGSAVFGIFDDEIKAENCLNSLKKCNNQVFLCKPTKNIH